MKEYNWKDIRLLIDGKEIELRGVSGDIVVIERDPDYTPKKIVKVFEGTAKVRYCVIGAGPVGHPEVIFKKICEQQGWEYVSGEGHPIGDCWIFEVKHFNTSSFGYLPSYISILHTTVVEDD